MKKNPTAFLTQLFLWEVLTQFLIRKLLCTFTGRKARVSLATGAMCNRSEWLLLHPSFLGVRLHIFYKDNGITGQILPCSTLRVKSFNGKDAIRTGNLRENINCIMRLLPLSNSGLTVQFKVQNILCVCIYIYIYSKKTPPSILFHPHQSTTKLAHIYLQLKLKVNCRWAISW